MSKDKELSMKIRPLDDRVVVHEQRHRCLGREPTCRRHVRPGQEALVSVRVPASDDQRGACASSGSL